MESTTKSRYLSISVLFTSLAVTFLVTPFNSIDPVNLPKLCLLVVLSFTSIGLASSDIQFFKAKINRPVVFVVTVFIVQLLFVLIFDDRDFAYKFYGTFGRNTGFAAYLSLAFLFIISVICSSKSLLKRYLLGILGSGAILALYGFFQSKGLDFYQISSGYGTNVFGTFGNPNFQSAFMGITSAAALSLVLFSRISKLYKACLFCLLVVSIYNISISSQQGYLNLAAGVAVATVIFLFKCQKPFLGWLAVVFSSFVGFLIFLGILNIGPLAQAVYKSSLQARGFYWRAAIKMILEHPVFGVGMDGFGDEYLRFRTTDIAVVNSGITADTAHNIPLDIGSNGGFFLLTSYLAIVMLVVISIIKVLKRNVEFDVVFTAIVAGWVAYQAQSLISINQLGLGVWGWSLSGLIIGYELGTRAESSVVNHKVTPSKKVAKEKVSSFVIVMTFLSTSVGIGIALPPYVAATKFYSALQSGDPTIIQNAAYLKPNDRFRYLYVARALLENKFESQAVSVLRDASTIYPDSIDLWEMWISVPSASVADVAHARQEMKRLDPYNPDLK
jgi:O-antigen ligase